MQLPSTFDCTVNKTPRSSSRRLLASINRPIRRGAYRRRFPLASLMRDDNRRLESSRALSLSLSLCLSLSLGEHGEIREDRPSAKWDVIHEMTLPYFFFFLLSAISQQRTFFVTPCARNGASARLSDNGMIVAQWGQLGLEIRVFSVVPLEARGVLKRIVL